MTCVKEQKFTAEKVGKLKKIDLKERNVSSLFVLKIDLFMNAFGLMKNEERNLQTVFVTNRPTLSIYLFLPL